jgi:Domain of unknown function (DUF6883)
VNTQSDQPETPDLPAAVFLFDTEQLVGIEPMAYRRPALKAVLSAVLAADVDRKARFQLRQGDVLLHTLAYTVSGVEFKPGAKANTTSISEQGDTDLYRTLIWDFCDVLGERWHSLDLDLLAQKLGHIDVTAIGLSALDLRQREAVDDLLNASVQYLGGFEPDPGNPVQRFVSKDSLILACDYQDGTLLFDPWESEDPFDPPPLSPHGEEWFDGLPLSGVRYKTEEELAEQTLVPPWPSEEFSPRGEQSARILEQRRDRGHLGEVAAIASKSGFSKDAPPFSIDVAAMSNPADAVVEEKKLTEYALNPDHKDGGDKARWFLAALGIQQQDWRHLAGQLRLGLPRAVPEEVRSTDYGLRYSIVTTVSGLNGATARVRSVWEIRSNAAPRLVTAYPADRKEDSPDAPPALVLSSSLEDDDRWSALWELADGHALQAAANVVPTPMKVDGQWYSEGAFGFATVGVRDARRGFARWLRQTERAHLESRRGAVMFAPGPMIDRARTYAEAFAEVLSLNGIEADVRWRLD